MPTLPTPIQPVPGIPSQTNKARRRNKKNTISKEIVKVSLFANDLILYLKDPKNATQKLLHSKNIFSHVAGYKIKLQKSVAFLHTNNEQSEKKYEKTIPFILASKKSNTQE
jgi:hypothetical protein